MSKKRVRKLLHGTTPVDKEIKLLRSLKHGNIIRLIDVYCKLEKADDDTECGMFNWFSGIDENPVV